MASIYGKNLTVSVFGQSHSAAIGCVIDGLPAGEKIDPEVLAKFMQRRAPGQNRYSTPRQEKDRPELVSGVTEGTNGEFVTCGAPLCAVIRNTDCRSKDYDKIRDLPRPAHADLTAQIKYGGHQDVRGGGHFSGRLTAPLCVAGGICKQILERKGIYVSAHIRSIGEVEDTPFDPISPNAQMQLLDTRDFPTIAPEKGDQMKAVIESCRTEQDSIGGVIECVVTGVPAGLGDPMFDGVENRIAGAVFGIPAVKGIEFGAGFEVAKMHGSENNDPFTMENGKIVTTSNNHGGILGGITSSMPIIFRVAFKPTPSISKKQQTVSLSKNESAELQIEGRHDPCIVPRAVAVVEAVTATVIMDLMTTIK